MGVAEKNLGLQEFSISFIFYRAMHYSAKRGIEIACRLSVCL